MDEAGILQFLDQHAIAYERVEHPPVYTCAEADLLRPDLRGVSTKNLFLRDEKSQHFYMLLTDCAKRADLTSLGRSLGVKKLHLGSADRLLDLIGVTPGAVTVLGLINDLEGQVELLFDREVWGRQAYLCHPLVNTATLVIPLQDLLRFFVLTNHPPHLVDI